MTKPKRIRITVEFTDIDQAAYAHMMISRLGWSECFEQTEPHLPLDQRKARAYAMIAALSKIEGALGDAEVPRRIYS